MLVQNAIITHLFLLTQPGYEPLNLLSKSMTTQLFQKAGQLFLFKRGGNRFFHEAQEWCNNKRTQNELSKERAVSKQRAFHNNMQIRQFHVERVLAHQLANEIMQGTSWREDAAGAVGCTLESNQHSRYEEELGIPRQLAYLEDRIFEGLPNKEAKGFPFAFLTSIPVGADLSLVLARFMVWLLIDPEKGVLRLVGKQGQAITAVASLYQRVIEGEAVSTQDWLSALTTASTRGQAAVDAANTFTTASAFSVAAAATSASLAFHATVVAAAVAYVSYGTGDVDPAVTNAVTATVTTLGYGNIAAVAADYGDAAAFMAAYGDDLAAFAGFAADRSAAACDPEKENSMARKVHYQVMRDKLLALLKTAPAGEKEDAPKGLPD